ncbi:hypothetical protein D7030_13930 [Flavobacteriaceae bacterium AU392]|nr:hypothetical protein D1817_04560 [Flavobacteriaceae bacterium]RKM81401.1 hypothetical protein D7030_13930 [Flavobacteriaceae bacterium AU392]
MIKFFRKIRQKLLSENKFSKYLIYAIGEIVLVVIGILIALQVNNWNESRVQRQKEIVILSELKKELEDDLETEFIPAIDYLKETNQTTLKLWRYYNEYHNNNSKIIPKDSLRYYLSSTTSKWYFVLNLGAYESLKSSGIDIISNDSLRSKISTMYSTHYPENEPKSNVVNNYIDKEIKPILLDNFPLSSTNEHNFLTNSPKFINRVAGVINVRRTLIETLNRMKPEIEILIQEISKEIDRIKE